MRHFITAVLALVALAAPAIAQISLGLQPHAQNGICPPERPHKRVVTQYPTTINAVGCLPRMVCGAERCAYETAACVRQQMPADVEICLSTQELDLAR